MLLKQIYQSVILYLRSKLSRVQFIVLIASITGLTSGIIAVLLKVILHQLQRLVDASNLSRFGFFLLPALGLVTTVFIIRKYFNKHIERGIAMVLKAIAHKSSFIPVSHTYLHVITSSITVGLGGSAGLEAPIVATGSAVGSNLARISELDYRERTLLIACGAAAGISAVFNAPIAGVIFAIEILLTETIVSYFIPLIISSVGGALCSKIILNEESLFNFILQEDFDYTNVPFYILLGVMAGFISLYYAHSFRSVEQRLHKWKFNAYLKAITGGLMLMAIYLLFPALYGEGYQHVKMVANGNPISSINNSTLFLWLGENAALIIIPAFIVLIKPLAAAITIGSGGNGGNFAPSLFTGAYLGYFFSRSVNSTPWIKIPESNFTLVGMAGVLSGVMYCPLTAIFLIAEITNGYELFIPLMIVSSISFFIVKSYHAHSMELRALAREGHVLTNKKEQNILTEINLNELLLDKYESVGVDKTMGDLVDIIMRSEKNIFAVHDSKENFVGVIELNDVKQYLFQPDKYSSLSVRTIMKKAGALIYADEKMMSVMRKFDDTQSWYLPVIDADKKFMGFVSKTTLFTKYREILSQQNDLYDN